MWPGDSPPGEGRSARGRADEEARLADSVTGLTALSARSLSLRELLTGVARYAVEAIPGADGAGLTLLEGDRVGAMVATADFVSAVDAVQYGLGDGPCIVAARDATTVVSGSLGDEARWGSFGGQVAAMGVHSVVSLPLRLGSEVLGAMNVYAHAHDAFDARAAELGEAFAAPAAVAVQHAHVLDQARRVAEQLRTALDARMALEQAVGVLIGRDGVDAEEAYRRIEAWGEERGEPLEVVARAVVDDAAHQARVRGTTNP